jgi:hypothetical protein
MSARIDHTIERLYNLNVGVIGRGAERQPPLPGLEPGRGNA